MEIGRIHSCGNWEDAQLWKFGGFTVVEILRIHSCGNSKDSQLWKF